MGDVANSRGRGVRAYGRRSAWLVAVVALSTVTFDVPAARAAAPGTPELVAPALDHVFGPADPQVFTIRAVDPEGDHWSGLVEVTNLDTGRVTSFATAPSNSGEFSGGVATPALTQGRYTWRARAVDTTLGIGPWSASSAFRVGSNRAPGAPSLLAPANGAVLRRNGNEPFSIASIDDDGDPITGTVVVRHADGTEVARFPTSPAPSGGPSSGVLVESLREGVYTWTAAAEDVHGAVSEPATSRSFSVGPPPTAGGGLVSGTVAYASPGVPLGVCAATSSTFELHSAVAVFNIAIVGYVGPVVVRGTGQSACESFQFATGTVALDITDTGTTDSTLACADLTGSYSRIATELILAITGGCIVNDFPISRVALTATLQFAPADVPEDLSGAVNRAVVTGPFVVRPE